MNILQRVEQLENWFWTVRGALASLTPSAPTSGIVQWDGDGTSDRIIRTGLSTQAVTAWVQSGGANNVLTIFKTPLDGGDAWRVWDNGNPGNGLVFNANGTLTVQAGGSGGFALNQAGRHYVALVSTVVP